MEIFFFQLRLSVDEVFPLCKVVGNIIFRVDPDYKVVSSRRPLCIWKYRPIFLSVLGKRPKTDTSQKCGRLKM
jgi:hypothetical protein